MRSALEFILVVAGVFYVCGALAMGLLFPLGSMWVCDENKRPETRRWRRWEGVLCAMIGWPIVLAAMLKSMRSKGD